MVRFPYARGYEAPDELFLALWKIWFDRFAPSGWDLARTGRLPRLHSRDVLRVQLEKKRKFSLDVLCRVMVPPRARNTMQATASFMAENFDLVKAAKVTNPVTGREVSGARLTPKARELLLELGQAWFDQAEAMLEADFDGLSKLGEQKLPDIPLTEVTSDLEETAAPALSDPSDRRELIEALVNSINIDPLQPMFRGKPLRRPPVVGWAARLDAYFWPNPRVGYSETLERLAPLQERAAALATTCEDGWSDKERDEAVDLADEIFRWGGVPQRNVTADVVRSVFRSAIEVSGDLGAPMNSGWTKVAAIATAHLERSGGAQAIWDSRVSNSLVTRLDALLARVGVHNIPDCLSGLGEVPGRGGTRDKRSRVYRWPNAYGKWRSHFAAGAMVRDLRNQLNDQRIPRFPGSRETLWTVRDVEMVLFMDGY